MSSIVCTAKLEQPNCHDTYLLYPMYVNIRLPLPRIYALYSRLYGGYCRNKYIEYFQNMPMGELEGVKS